MGRDLDAEGTVGVTLTPTPGQMQSGMAGQDRRPKSVS